MTTNDPPQYPGADPGDSDSTNRPPDGSGVSEPSGPPSYGSAPPPEGGQPPPPPPPPPSTPGRYDGTDRAFSAPDAISWGWAKFKENVGQLLLAVLIIIGVAIVVGIVSSIIAPSNGMYGTGGFELSVGSLIGSLIVNAIGGAVEFVVSVAIARAVIDVTEGQKFEIGPAFGRINVANAAIAGLILGALYAIGFALFFLPGLIVAFFAYFTSYFVAEGTSPVDAIKESFGLVAANLGDSLLLAILSILVIIAGVIALCVGIFVAIPITMLAAGYAYRKFRGQPVAA